VIALIRRRPLTVFFVLAYAVAWAFWPFGSFGAFGPLVAALVVVPVAHGRAGLRSLGARMVRWRVSGLWWALAVGVPLGVHALSTAVATTTDAVRPTTTVTAVLLAFAVRLVNPTDGPLGEEPGWRGYAQPMLQGRGHSPLVAATVNAVLIAGWHLPLFFLEPGGPRTDTVVPGLVTTMAVTYWYAWLFNRSGGSALLTLVAHDVEGIIPAAEPWSYTAVWSALALALVLADLRRWRTAAPPPATGAVETSEAHSRWLTAQVAGLLDAPTRPRERS
jgi:uncharacterized protein